MAACDYIVYVKKNGKTLTHKKNGHWLYGVPIKLHNGMWMKIVKTSIFIADNIKFNDYKYYNTECWGDYPYCPYSKYRFKFEYNGLKFNIKRLFDSGIFYMRLHDQDDLYEILYGYDFRDGWVYPYSLYNNGLRLNRYIKENFWEADNE